MKKRREISVTFANGQQIRTEINGTEEEIVAYYKGNTFNLGRGEMDNMQSALDVIFTDKPGFMEDENGKILRFDPKVLGFTCEGKDIFNPMLSPCEQSAADPKDYGFIEVETGGGCVALDKIFDDGSYLRLTDDSGTGLPDPADWADALLGRYDSQGETVATISLRHLPPAPGALSAELADDQLAPLVDFSPGMS